MDSSVAPRRVLSGQAHNKLANHGWRRWSTTKRYSKPPIGPVQCRATMSRLTAHGSRLTVHRARCQRSSVVGVTILACQRSRGRRRASAASTTRSFDSNRGRMIWRPSTATSGASQPARCRWRPHRDLTATSPRPHRGLTAASPRPRGAIRPKRRWTST